MRIAIIAIFVVAPALMAQVGGQKFFRYQGQTIELGDTKYEVTAKLGRPDGKLQRQRHFLQKVDVASVQVDTVREEKWLYNFGPRRFFHILTFENHTLVCIEEGDYGYAYADAINCHVVKKRVKRGEITPVVLMKCGEPNYQESYTTEKYVRFDDYHSEKVTIKKEEWTYNYGPSQPLSILHFENGELVQIEQGPRGF